MLVVTGANGCVDTVRSVVTITRHGEIEMPNVFSPNGDGENDRFTPLDHNGVAGLLEIYNRWGQLDLQHYGIGRWLGWPRRGERGAGGDILLCGHTERCQREEASRPHYTCTMIRSTHVLLLLLWGSTVLAQEICNNGIDDDGDGLIDLNDPDCPCSTVLMAPDLQSYIRNHSFEDRLNGTCCPFGFVTPVSWPWLDCAAGWHQATAATSDYFNMCGYAPIGFNLPPPDGDGAVGFFAGPGYFEYVGTCLTYPAPDRRLLAGTTYTISLWISAGVTVNNHGQSRAQESYVAPFTDQFPLALFGHADVCVPFPVPTMDCIGYQSGWIELGRVSVQPAWAWTRVSITFTPTQDIHTIMIGGACDVPASFAHALITNPSTGETYSGAPFFLVDDLMLTVAGDQILQPVSSSGTLCAGTAAAIGTPPSGASNYQWYRDGVALPGQTGTTLNVSGGGYGAGQYTLASTFNGECLMGASYVPPAVPPLPTPVAEPFIGCAPLTVALADTTHGMAARQWDLGSGATRADSAFSYRYDTPGNYEVRLQVRNSAGCSGDTVLHVQVYPPVSGGIGIDPDPGNVEHPEVQLSGTGSGNIVSWWWDLGAAAPPNASDPSVTATFPAVPGSYPVMLVVTSAGGCVDTVRSVVRMVRPGVIEMPNVFSPNGDGKNEHFIPLNYDGSPGLLEIYNRWGQLDLQHARIGPRLERLGRAGRDVLLRGDP
ncbi:MAG: gliding motility-associated C-terminal domain-containing protein [Flavobacteriales bacterium]